MPAPPPRIPNAVDIGPDDSVLSLRDRLETAYDTISQLLEYLSRTKAQPGELRRLCAAFRARNIIPMYVQNRKTEFALRFDASDTLVEPRALRGTFVPERALRYAYIFGRRENIPREIMNDLLLALGAAFKQREQELRMQEVGELNDAVLDLKRRLSQKVPYNIVRAEEEIRHLRSELWRYRELYHRCKARVPRAIRVNFNEGGFSASGNSASWLSPGRAGGEAASRGSRDPGARRAFSAAGRGLSGADPQTLYLEDVEARQAQTQILDELRGLRGDLESAVRRSQSAGARAGAQATAQAPGAGPREPGDPLEPGYPEPYPEPDRSADRGAFPPAPRPDRGQSPFRAGFLAGHGGVPPPGTEEYLPFMAGCTHVARLMIQDIESLFDKIGAACARFSGGEEVMSIVRRYSAKFRSLLCSVMESLTQAQ